MRTFKQYLSEDSAPFVKNVDVRHVQIKNGGGWVPFS